jgi:hypothetical protein
MFLPKIFGDSGVIILSGFSLPELAGKSIPFVLLIGLRFFGKRRISLWGEHFLLFPIEILLLPH